MTKADVPSGLQERGRRLWSDSVAAKPEMAPGERVLLEEACRLADRLDVLDRLLAGDGETWGRIRHARDDDAPSTLIINAAVGEARMGAGELRQLVKALALAESVEPAQPKQRSKMDELLARREAKGA